jgi:hypothetical protein
MKEEIVGITYEGTAVCFTRTKDNLRFTVEKDKCFDNWLADPRMTAQGKPIGVLNRQMLHERLDQFLDNQPWEY